LRGVTGVIRLRAARVVGFDVVLEPLKVVSKLSKFGCSNTKTPIINSNLDLNYFSLRRSFLENRTAILST
jgi:hypothetical protein